MLYVYCAPLIKNISNKIDKKLWACIRSAVLRANVYHVQFVSLHVWYTLEILLHNRAEKPHT